jgi:tetratricopeptide (TPR) repeat protein
MFNILPLILILIGLTIVIVIVVRKFSVLAALDVDSIPAEREAKFKERIISSRLKRSFYKHFARLIRGIKPFLLIGKNFFRRWYEKLLEYKESYQEQNKRLSGEQSLNKFFREAKELKEKEDWGAAEKKYIKIISQDSKNIRAFRDLGDLYFQRKNYNEAKQTFEHVLKLVEREKEALVSVTDKEDEEEKQKLNDLNRQAAEIYFSLALVKNAVEDWPEALANVDRALNIEPNNPRYLDLKLKISIINKDKIAALDAYERLSKVNPDNNKLADFQEEIDKL